MHWRYLYEHNQKIRSSAQWLYIGEITPFSSNKMSP